MPAEGFVILTLGFHQEGRRWVGECLELGTSTYGRTLKQAKDELHELVTLHLNALEDAGECDRFFKTHAIRFFTDDAELAEKGPRLPVNRDDFFQAKTFPLPTLALAAV